MTFFPETIKQNVDVKTVKDCRYDSALPDAVTEVEEAGVLAVPFNICCLHHIDVEEKSDEDDRES